MNVTGTNNRQYTESNIANAKDLAEMRSTVLRNQAQQIVIPVNHPTRKHFRTVGKASAERLLGEAQDSTHDKCIVYLKRLLEEAGDSFQIVTLVPNFSAYIHSKSGRPAASKGEKKTYDLQPIFISEPGSCYKWFTGPSARVHFPDGSYIESDLCGKATASFCASRTMPDIVIEVIRTHPPDAATFEKLIELSTKNTFVLFFIIPEDSVESQINRAWRMRQLDLRVSFYLKDGLFYEAGIHIPESGCERAAVYAQLVSGVLKGAMSEAISIDQYDAQRGRAKPTTAQCVSAPSSEPGDH